MTKLIISDKTSPSFNLALEEYLVKNFKDDDIIMLWRNDKSVIIGKNQNAYAEIDLDFVKQHNIPVIRRLTGGGAVFHDLGNVNYTFITDYKEGEIDSFSHFAQPVCSFLGELGLSASFSGRNDILVDGKKISGTAKTVIGKRTLCHGCLLYSADMTFLSKALKPNNEKFSDKAVKSVKSRVVNICDLLEEKCSVESFVEKLSAFFAQNQETEIFALSENDIYNVRKIESEKYARDEYNFALSPTFEYKTQRKFDFALVECSMSASEGRIKEIKFFGDFFSDKDVKEMETALKNAPLEEKKLKDILRNINVSDYIKGSKIEDILSLILHI